MFVHNKTKHKMFGSLILQYQIISWAIKGINFRFKKLDIADQF